MRADARTAEQIREIAGGRPRCRFARPVASVMVLHAAVHLHGGVAGAHAGPVGAGVGAVVEPRHARARPYYRVWTDVVPNPVAQPLRLPLLCLLPALDGGVHVPRSCMQATQKK